MDRRTLKTKSAIRKAYFKLLMSSEVHNKISIAQIAREANIDRKTFYLHYDSIDAIIHEYITEKKDELFDYLAENAYFEDPFSSNLLFTSLEASMVEDEKLTRKILNSPFAQTFWDEIVDIVVNTAKEIYSDNITCSMEDFEFCARFCAHSFVAIYKDYIYGRTSSDLKHLVELTQSVAHNGVGQFIQKKKS